MPFIYIIAAADHSVKIGVAAAPHKRLLDLQTGCPFELKIHSTFMVVTEPLARAAERLIHKRLALYRLTGEWFKVTPAEAEAVITTIVGPPDLSEVEAAECGRRPLEPALSVAVVRKMERLAARREQNRRSQARFRARLYERGLTASGKPRSTKNSCIAGGSIKRRDRGT
jgi:hypothetical protein